MEYRPFGATGLSVSVLGFGAMRIPNKPEDEVARLLKRALELGITYVDTAPGYGNSEELIGKALAGVDTSGVAFSTKTHIGSDKDADAVRRRAEQSLQRMGIPRITVLQMWGINTWEMAERVLGKGGPLEGARKLQAEGLVGHVGFTTHAPPADALRVMETGEFVSVTGRYHYVDPVYDCLRRRAAELGMAFVAMTPLGQGWLAKPSPALREALGGDDPVRFALRWIVTQPGLTTAIVGLAAFEELEAAYAAIGGELGDPEAYSAGGARVLARVAEALGSDYCTECGRCLPCPEGINIPELLRLNGLLRAYDLVDWCKDRYKFMGNAGTWYPGVKADRCTECGDCEPRCPEGLAIVRLLKALHEDLFEGERGRLSHED
jgi:predicted aldo/keto reductase-like oxidoreductase